MTSTKPLPPEGGACDAISGRAWPGDQSPVGREEEEEEEEGRSAALESEGAEKDPSGEGEEQPLAMSSSDQGDHLAAAELDPSQAHQKEQPIQEDADCSPGQLPPEEAGHPKSYCQAWLLAPLEDARFLICCTNWY